MSKKISLTTHHDLTFWKNLEINGILKADGRKINIREFRPAYQWMKGQMRRRLADYAGGFPIWCWTDKAPRIDQVKKEFSINQQFVRARLLIDESRVLLSDFDDWHYILNQYYLPDNDADEHRFEQSVFALTGDKYCSFENLPSEFQKEISDSWQRIFAADHFKNDSPIQGVIECIYPEDIDSIEIFHGKNKSFTKKSGN